jgi:hypothetical protein
MKLFIALILLNGYTTEIPMADGPTCRNVAYWVRQAKEVKDAQCMVRLKDKSVHHILDLQGTMEHPSPCESKPKLCE